MFLIIKSVLALVLGFLLGYFKITGMIGFMVFLPVQYLAGQLYCTQFKIPDYLMDSGEMFTTQCLPSFGLFLVGGKFYDFFRWFG
uniref:Rab5-interacting protein (Rab5ip), putative n=1 Tax=Theileria annulata TaxID=5874 RepID=A0A3B0MYS4_THEAN